MPADPGPWASREACVQAQGPLLEASLRGTAPSWPGLLGGNCSRIPGTWQRSSCRGRLGPPGLTGHLGLS